MAANNADIPDEQPAAEVLQVNDQLIKINREPYKVVVNHQQAFDPERLALRYHAILDKYDYIVGDWGYGQLRLRGFYEMNRPQAKIDQKIDTLQDYLLEYCNFGCAYFVLEKEHETTQHHANFATNKSPKQHRATNKKSNRNNNNGRNHFRRRPLQQNSKLAKLTKIAIKK
ncbi:YutD family protein [Bombilactobacillus folatiphilus]|uniref:YutD family protein n=1 Tax=Bombilactobacillus folatiphilus TaxID=2923362 RepID=A0ABY4PAX6_9LACO|nr:YutD family protein [Bombilactobacillus folatiphilus]UQS82864.1 YutD family protein [Bombilactobacillus folatiphilus]